MKAQVLYDFHEEFEFCYGADLHDFFEDETGDPSPIGAETVSIENADKFVMNCLKAMAHNSPGLKDHCAKASDEWVKILLYNTRIEMD